MASKKITEQPTPTTTVPQFVLPTGPTGSEGSTGVTANYQVYIEAKFNEAYTALRSIPTLKGRLELLNKLYKKGWYKGSEPSVSGLTTDDIIVYRDLLVYADVANLKAGDLTKSVEQLPDVIVEKSGTARKTPAGDVDSMFKQVMQRDLGRAPRADEMAKFRQAYSGLEAGGNAPSLTAAAEEQIMSANTSESQAAQFAGFADVFEQMMRGA
jgi:hypothetical protein